MPVLSDSASKRFWPKVEKTDTCWLWTGYINGDGYGVFSAENRRTRAHRWSYETLAGSIPEGFDLDHLCRTRHCVNPDHLEPVTRQENLSRGIGSETTRNRFAAISHCPQGHPYSEENTRIKMKNGYRTRSCRECGRLYDRSKRTR